MISRQEWDAAHDAALKAIKEAGAVETVSAEKLEEIRVALMARKGAPITDLLKSIKDLAPEDKRECGPKANALKSELESKIAARRKALEREADEAALGKASLDLTLPGFKPARGRLHPLTQTLREMTNILSLLGFSWAEGPFVEDDQHNFTALNIPESHPARDMHDTFYLQDVPRLMRTHTSPVQIRSMESARPPLRIMCPGRVFRHEAVDATHSAVFHQVEGLYVDKRVTFADLKGTLAEFMKKLLGSSSMRFRPSFFPFTEPSTEVDVQCLFCKGQGCGICKQSGWIELLGAGLVHPNVFTAVGYDPEQWSGFAFGIGVERLAMLRLGVKDIRQFYENDARFLRQFDESLV